MSPGQHDLIRLVKKYALKYGDFTLKSGQKSLFYLDCRKLTISTHLPLIVDGIKAAAEGYPGNLPMIPYDAVGGPSVGADPIVGAFLCSHTPLDAPLRGFIVRKEEKGHGLDGLVIGSVQKGDRCLVVEDVTTTAGSAIKAIEAVHAFGAKVVVVASLIDRSGGLAETNLGMHLGIPFRSVLTLEDLNLSGKPEINEQYLQDAVTQASQTRLMDGDQPATWHFPESIEAICRLVVEKPSMRAVTDRLHFEKVGENNRLSRIFIRPDVYSKD